MTSPGPGTHSHQPAAAERCGNERKVLTELGVTSDELTTDLYTDAAQLREKRMRPITEMSQRVWTTLRRQSSVELGGVSLQGNTASRKVGLDVTVDGVAGAALGVMSQGELHALGL